MVSTGVDLFSKKKHETIMLLGSSVIFDELFKAIVAQRGAHTFTVIVVDCAPLFPGR